MKEEYVACDLCGADDYAVVWDKQERLQQGVLAGRIIIEDGHIYNGRVVACKKCGMIYVNPRLDRESLDEFYATEYRRVYGSEADLDSEKEHAQHAMECLQDIWQPDFKHLDVGCSRGTLIALTDGYGIEPNLEHYSVAREIDRPIWNTTLEDFISPWKWDVVSIMNTLEHLLSPTAMLIKIRELLKEDGYLLLSVPNTNNHNIRLPQDAFLSNAHIYHFDKRTIGRLLNKCGFQPVMVGEVAESIGEKLFVLSRLSEPVELEYEVPDNYPDLVKAHFDTCQRIFDIKAEFQRRGFK
jgi:SAM-dependent methyltransferase